MIKRQTAFVVGDKVFSSLDDAKKESLMALFVSEGGRSPEHERIAHYLVTNSDKVVDILTTTETSLTAARKINGGKKTRKKPAAASEPPPPELPGMEPKAA